METTSAKRTTQKGKRRGREKAFGDAEVARLEEPTESAATGMAFVAPTSGSANADLITQASCAGEYRVVSSEEEYTDTRKDAKKKTRKERRLNVGCSLPVEIGEHTTVAELAETIQVWMKELERKIRLCGALKDTASGGVWSAILKTKEAAKRIVTLARLESQDAFLRMNNTALIRRNKELKEEIDRLKSKNSPLSTTIKKANFLKEKVERTQRVPDRSRGRGDATRGLVQNNSVQNAKKEEEHSDREHHPLQMEARPGDCVDNRWVVARNSKRRRWEKAANPGGTKSDRGNGTKPTHSTRPRSKGPTMRPPRTEAISIRAPEQTSYADILRTARTNIPLKDIGIEAPRMRRTATGGMLIEISGPDRKEKANILEHKLRSILGKKAIIDRPKKTMEIRITGIEDSVTEDEAKEALAELGPFPIQNIRTGSIKREPGRLGTMWARIPTEAASKLSQLSRIRMGWTMARVAILDKRPLQCFRCLEFGHVQARCRETNTCEVCFRCGARGHKAAGCQRDTRCILCQRRGTDSSHRMGGAACATAARAKGMATSRRRGTGPAITWTAR